MFDQNFAVVGEALSSKLPFSKTVFVMVRAPATSQSTLHPLWNLLHLVP